MIVCSENHAHRIDCAYARLGWGNWQRDLVVDAGRHAGGIATSIFLNTRVIPALYLKYGRAESSVASEAYPQEGELASISYKPVNNCF